ncbi:MAG: acylphosphatase [Gemmatimonadales bacterium]
MADGPSLACRRWVLAGRVQGVGFRWFVLNNAQALGIRGWVANTPDGAVEVVGVPSGETLAKFEALLTKGPPAARVTEITIQDVPHDSVDSKSFIIKH